MNLIARLNTLGKNVMDKHPTINWGGCCVFASRVAKRLEGVVERVAVRVGNDYGEYYDGQHLDHVRNNIQKNTPRQWNRHGIYFAHVIVEFDYRGRTYHYDALGAKKARNSTNMHGYPIIDGELTVQEATELANVKAGWNPSFDRAEIPYVEKLINDAFDAIEKASA